MRWPNTLSIILAPPPAPKVFVPWVGHAYIESVVVAAMTLAHSDDAKFARQMRPLLLDHAERLVEILRGDEPTPDKVMQ